MRQPVEIRLGRAPAACDHCSAAIAPHSTVWLFYGGTFCSEQHALDHHPAPSEAA